MPRTCNRANPRLPTYRYSSKPRAHLPLEYQSMSGSTVSTGAAALVTGASRGIGKAVALRLASQGMAVAVNYNSSAQEAEEVVRCIEDGGGHAVALRADMADAADAA